MSSALKEIERIATVLASDNQISFVDLQRVTVQAEASVAECFKWDLPVPLETYRILKILRATMRMRWQDFG